MLKQIIYGLFGINKENLNNRIISLEKQRGSLNPIIDDVMEPLIRKKFPNMEYSRIFEVYGEKINNIKSSLYDEYSHEIDWRISRLNLLKKEISR